ncbi:MAG: hypothetical protein R3C11_03660 [Planctomycetaceae bacterium]
MEISVATLTVLSEAGLVEPVKEPTSSRPRRCTASPEPTANASLNTSPCWNRSSPTQVDVKEAKSSGTSPVAGHRRDLLLSPVLMATNRFSLFA